MGGYWDNKFREVKSSWGIEPSDSAISAKDFFLGHNICDILIPGVGYGRNANIFLQNGINVTGIEISEYAINIAKDVYKLDFPIYHGSVTDMPFDDKRYDGIYCHALIHLLNKPERKRFIQNCFNQLKPNGYMIFTFVSKKSGMYKNGRFLSKDRYEIEKGLNVFFYDLESAKNEFNDFGSFDIQEIDEPIKHMVNEPPLKCIMVKCKRNNHNEKDQTGPRVAGIY
jgi:SAM-dependent methyltransferase